METYIIRIHRADSSEDREQTAGLIEDVERGRTKRFSGPQELLRLLRLLPEGVRRKTGAGGRYVARTKAAEHAAGSRMLGEKP